MRRATDERLIKEKMITLDEEAVKLKQKKGK